MEINCPKQSWNERKINHQTWSWKPFFEKIIKIQAFGPKKVQPSLGLFPTHVHSPHVPKHKRKRFRNLVFQKINSIALDWKCESGGCVDVRFLGEGFGVVFVMYMQRARALICDNAKSLFGWFYLFLKNHGLKRGATINTWLWVQQILHFFLFFFLCKRYSNVSNSLQHHHHSLYVCLKN